MKYETNEYYHVYNRGTDKRDIFLSKSDYKRFFLSLEEFNTSERITHFGRSIPGRPPRSTKHNGLVEIVDYCLMPNHFHLILKQLQDEGISKFIQKFAAGYTKYFNAKYERSGVLFQGKTKNKHVDSDEYFQYLVEYVYLNPVDLIEPGWKEKGMQNPEQVIEFLDNYPWSSCNNHRKIVKSLSI